MRDGVDPAVILKAVLRFKEEVHGKDPQFIAYASTWLNGERYNDEASEPARKDTGWQDDDDAWA